MTDCGQQQTKQAKPPGQHFVEVGKATKRIRNERASYWDAGVLHPKHETCAHISIETKIDLELILISLMMLEISLERHSHLGRGDNEDENFERTLKFH